MFWKLSGEFTSKAISLNIFVVEVKVHFTIYGADVLRSITYLVKHVE